MLSSQSFFSTAVALLASTTFFQNVAAQVTTDCFPMNTTNCPPDPALSMDIGFNFTKQPDPKIWETHVGPVTYDSDNGAGFAIKKQGDCPTLRSKFYFFWGRVEIVMKAAPGTGVISSIMLLSDNLDEIDIEFKGGNKTMAQSNYFGKGLPDFHNAGYHEVPSGVQNDFHNYTILWTKSALDFYIDSTKVRTLLPKDANNSYYYPQTPMRVFLGIWAGGDPSLPKGTIDWAGGKTDYAAGPYEMFIKSVHVEDFSNGKEYVYGDQTGSWQSIKVVAGNSTTQDVINNVDTSTPAPSVADKWNAMSPTAKIAVYATGAGVGAAIVAFALFYCIKQRRRGAREARIAEAKAEQERLELQRFKEAGVDPDSFTDTATEYSAKEMRRDGLSDQTSYSVPASPAPANTPNEKWEKAAAIGVGAGAGAAAAGGMRSPMPLLREGAQSPRVTSPTSPGNAFNAPYSDRPANTRSPAPTFPNSGPPGGMMNGGMGASPTSPYAQPAMRSFSSPNTNMRVGSPGPQQPEFGGMRTASPNPIGQPQPQRSFTGTGAYGGGYGNGGQGTGFNSGGGYGNGAANGGGQGYWGNGSYR